MLNYGKKLYIYIHTYIHTRIIETRVPVAFTVLGHTVAT